MMLGKDPDVLIGPTLLLHTFISYGSSATFTRCHRSCCCTFYNISYLVSHRNTDAILGCVFVVSIIRRQFLFVLASSPKTVFPIPAYTTVTSLLDSRSLWHSLKMHGSGEIKGETLPLGQSNILTRMYFNI